MPAGGPRCQWPQQRRPKRATSEVATVTDIDYRIMAASGCDSGLQTALALTASRLQPLKSESACDWKPAAGGNPFQKPIKNQ